MWTKTIPSGNRAIKIQLNSIQCSCMFGKAYMYSIILTMHLFLHSLESPKWEYSHWNTSQCILFNISVIVCIILHSFEPSITWMLKRSSGVPSNWKVTMVSMEVTFNLGTAWMKITLFMVPMYHSAHTKLHTSYSNDWVFAWLVMAKHIVSPAVFSCQWEEESSSTTQHPHNPHSPRA